MFKLCFLHLLNYFFSFLLYFVCIIYTLQMYFLCNLCALQIVPRELPVITIHNIVATNSNSIKTPSQIDTRIFYYLICFVEVLITQRNQKIKEIISRMGGQRGRQRDGIFIFFYSFLFYSFLFYNIIQAPSRWHTYVYKHMHKRKRIYAKHLLQLHVQLTQQAYKNIHTANQRVFMYIE